MDTRDPCGCFVTLLSFAHDKCLVAIENNKEKSLCGLDWNHQRNSQKERPKS